MGFLETYDRRRAGLQVQIHRSLRSSVGPMPAPIACQDADRPHVVAVGVWPSDLPAVHVIDWVAGSLARPCMLQNLLLWMRVIAAILNDRVARHHRGDARGRRLPSRHVAIAPLALAHGPHYRGCGDLTPHERRRRLLAQSGAP